MAVVMKIRKFHVNAPTKHHFGRTLEIVSNASLSMRLSMAYSSTPSTRTW